MEMDDGVTYSANIVFDYKINTEQVEQPVLPEPSMLKQLWYGFGRLEALYQVNHTATARATNQGRYNEIVFTPNIIKELNNNPNARIVARNHVARNLKRLGFKTIVDNKNDHASQPDMRVHVPLNVLRNLCRMRIFGPYLLFEKPFVLTQAALSCKKSKTK